MRNGRFDSEENLPNGNRDDSFYNREQRKPRIPRTNSGEGLYNSGSNRNYDHSAYRDQSRYQDNQRNDYQSNRYGQNNQRPYRQNYNPNYNPNYRRENNYDQRPQYGQRQHQGYQRYGNQNGGYRDNYNPNYRNDRYEQRPYRDNYNPNYRNDRYDRGQDRGYDRPPQRFFENRRPPFRDQRNDFYGTRPSGIHLSKAISKLSYGSPRVCLKAIQNGLVTVNGEIVRNPRAWVNSFRDDFVVNGIPIHQRLDRMYIVVHKQKDFAGSYEFNVPSMYKLMKHKEGWFAPLGCLDMGSSGLVIYTNDIESKREYGASIKYAKKTYRIKVHVPFADETGTEIKELQEFMQDKLQEKCIVNLDQNNTKSCWISVVVKESSPKDIRKALKEYGLETLSFERYAIGHLSLDDLHPGSWRRLSDLDIGRLLEGSK